MPRPEIKEITFSIDGREVTAPENMMLVDAAKQGDVEIPVFCYEPKLGQPVGACRMCLVEVEGIPKLQTACSTPVKDGMVVHTQTERVRDAQAAVVEFLLVNHPLDCPVCDKGGECPLQDISFGWGGGRSRFIEPKRHFQKPLALSPLVAIDRERCILCYRCVRFSQEVSEDYQLILEERGADTYVATFDGHPYVAPFSGNIVELCPVGALTSKPYRFRARPWDIENSGSVCTLCPSQCNVTFTVRDERVLRVLGRDNEEVDDGWLCDKGRFAYQAVHVDERVTRADGPRRRRAAAGVVGARARRGRRRARAARRAASARSSAARRRTRRASSSSACCARRSTRATSTRRRYGSRPREDLVALADPRLQATVADLEFAHAVLVLDCEPVDDAPILDLRIRKGVRRRGTEARRRDVAPVVARPERRRASCASRRAAAERSPPRSPRRVARRRPPPRRGPRRRAGRRRAASRGGPGGRDRVRRADRRRRAGAAPGRGARAARRRRRRAARGPRRHERARAARGRLRARRRARLRRGRGGPHDAADRRGARQPAS